MGRLLLLSPPTLPGLWAEQPCRKELHPGRWVLYPVGGASEMLLGLKIEFLEHKILDYVMRNEFHVSRKLGTHCFAKFALGETIVAFSM